MSRVGQRRWRGPALSACLVVGVVLAGMFLWPRRFIANDDPGLVELLRAGYPAPFLSLPLSRLLNALYRVAPGLPWYGLWLYALPGAALACAISAVAAASDAAGGLSRWARGALIALAALATLQLITEITFTVSAIAAAGAALAALVAEVARADAGEAPRRVRLMLIGLVLAAGVATRLSAGMAVVAVLAPLVAWSVWRGWRRRRPMDRRAALALAAPLVLLGALTPVAHLTMSPEAARYLAFNRVRGQMHSWPAFIRIDQRAPEVLARAHWTRAQSYWFQRWMFFDERDFSIERLEALLATGGKPRPFPTHIVKRKLAGQMKPGMAGSWVVAGAAVALALLVLGRVSVGAALVALGEVPWLVGLILLALARARFPERIGLPMVEVAAVGSAVALASGIRRARAKISSARLAVAGVLGLCAVVLVARPVVSLVRHQGLPHSSPVLREIDQRIAELNGHVVVYDGAASNRDPLALSPRAYPAIELGWPTFSPLFYRNLRALGVEHGYQLLPALVDNPHAYVLTYRRYRGRFVRYYRNRLHLDVKLEVVLRFPQARSILYRVVSATRP